MMRRNKLRMLRMMKIVMCRNPGGKPSKPGKPGGGKPFERPEGENWVRR